MILVAPRPADWNLRFGEHTTRISTAAPDARIEHIGSTAIGGIASKDVVDILVGTAPPAHSGMVETLTTNGYVLEGERDRHAWLCWPDVACRQVIIHVVDLDGREWHRRLLFRDRLRSDPALAARYQALKLAIAADTDNWGEYTARKADFVREALSG
ncbi:GrpB family protein [Microlunatus soli]|uniref:GrpB family protein n=1 Tax=Microlunatus soli TaxID=630515 RepID=UPI0012F7D340|nr:GrpB family protein [Microlunatus soli]